MIKTTRPQMQSLNDYLSQEFSDILTIPKQKLLFKFRSKSSGILYILLGVIALVFSVWLVYSGLTHQDYLYGYGIYIVDVGTQDWQAVWMGLVLIPIALVLFVCAINVRRFRLKIYPTKIKGYAFTKTLNPFVMPCEIPVSKITSFSHFPGYVRIKTEDNTYIFRTRRMKKALRMLTFVSEAYESLYA